jgi:hypothetical protein
MSCYPETRKGRTTGKWIAEVTLPGLGRMRERFATKGLNTMSPVGHHAPLRWNQQVGRCCAWPAARECI